MRTAEQVRYLILAAQREGNRQLGISLSVLGLTPAQSEALILIADHGPLALKELGDMLVCDTGASPSRIVDRLVTAGLVDRTGSEHDRRQIRLDITTQGQDTAAQVRHLEDRLYDSIDNALSTHGAQTLVRTLRALTRDSAAGTALNKRLAAEAPSDHQFH